MAVTEQELQVQIHARMLEALNSREKEFSTLTSLLEDIVFQCTASGKICLLNDAWERILGWSVNESQGKQLFDYQDPDWHEVNFPDRDESGGVVASELRLVARNGEGHSFKLKASFSNGYWYGSLTDVTEYRNALSELYEARENEKKLSLVASRTDNQVIITDAQGAIEWVNASFERETGFSSEEVVGRRPSEFLQGPETSLQTVETMREGLARGEGFSVEIINYGKDGQPYWVEIDCSPVKNEGGEITNFIAMERVITERKASEQALKDSEAHFRGILDTVSEAIFYCDTELLIQYANPAWTGMTGHELSDGEAVELSGFVHCDDLPRLEAMAEQIANGELQAREELRVINNDGGWRHVDVILSKSNNESHFAITGALIDIDERWHANKAMQEAKDRAERLSRTRTQFVANMSHEIRTPLNAIIGMSNVLKNTQLNNEQAGYVDTLLNGGKALLALVNDILDLSKLDSGEIEFENKPYDILEIAEQCVDVMANSVQQKKIRLQLTVGESLSRIQMGDAHRLRQILFNLLSNAIKFTEEGEVGIHLDEEVVNGGRILKLSVVDTGIGIEAEKLTSLFDAFTQADATITRQYGGTGLGLSICKQIIERMGGRIKVESEPGRGTRFSCELPTRFVEPVESTGVVHIYNLPTDVEVRVRSAARVLGRTVMRHTDSKGEGIALQQHGGIISPRLPVVIDSICTPRRLLNLVRTVNLAENTPQVKQDRAARILLAEDVIPNQLVATAMLKQLGYHNITVVETGQQALEKARGTRFDIALLDIHMPVMDGIAAASLLSEEQLIPTLIAASADVTHEARARAIAAGFHDMLPKPFTREALGALLTRYLGDGQS